MQHLLCRSCRYLAFIFLIALFCATSTLAQVGKLEVTRNVNLRSDPSTQVDPITLLRPSEILDLVEAGKTDGYYHVRTDEGEEGWVWAKNVKLISDETLIQPPSGSLANQISAAWAKGTPSKTTFIGIEGQCPYNGNGFDPDQYMLKNRTDIPASYHDVTWSAIRSLPFPGKDDLANHAPKHRKEWLQPQLNVILPFEGIPVRVTGYVVAIRQQNGGTGEGTNCKFNKVRDVDTHVALVESFGDGEGDAIVVEWTPRFLKDHSKWKNTRLEPWRDSEHPVRISGWLMVDPDHWDMIGSYRGTIWEIHPITRIEVWKDGAFVDLDSLP